jgi:predicted unusual protein kinase regulating ubiquinone biosynthesis (AarF/ABC1/UbiB family)
MNSQNSQDSIESTPVTRIAALAGAGVKVGVNYLKHYGRRAVGASSTDAELQERNASTVYETFSRLKGGPLKLAQMLSIDSNLLPEAYLKQFAKAQYSAPPLSYPLVVRTFRREFGVEPSALFDTFSQTAAHGASIGQVHRASKAGREYAVKVQYPGVADSLRSDIRVLKPIALQLLGLKERDVQEYLKEVETRLLEETDYALELRRSMELSERCKHLTNVRFTEYFPTLSSARILTMAWVEGVTLDKFADSTAIQEARDVIGQALWDFYAHQVHVLRLFHADPHPGNFLVKDGQLWVLDFGCAKQLDDHFYQKQFRFLDLHLVEDSARFESALLDLEILLPTDKGPERERIIELCAQSVSLLALPFRDESFDFGDPLFMRAVYEMGEENSRSEATRDLQGRRGSPHSVYVNRAFFGVYSLLTRLRAKVRTGLPEALRAKMA